MSSMYGCNGGDSEPGGLIAPRTVSLIALNQLREQAGSRVRVIGFHCPGLHNGVMILPVTTAFFATLTAEQVTEGLPCMPEEVIAREAIGYANAVCAARALDLDDSVTACSRPHRRNTHVP